MSSETKTLKAVRGILLEQMDSLAKGKADIKDAKAITKISAQVIYSTRVELENKRLELELSKSTDDVKNWMSKDFSTIQTIKV